MPDAKKVIPQDVEEKLLGYSAVTIPVHVDVDVKHTVVELREAEKILREATVISLGDCTCRKTEGNCDKPVNTCLILNQKVEGTPEWDSSFHEVSVDKALSVLKESHEAGLVHLAFRNKDGEIHEFCSCCDCCCWFLGILKQYDYHHGVAESSHVAQHLPEKCVACGLCVQECSFDAWMPGEDGGKPTLLTNKCFGCGVCVTACPSQAIAFVEREGKSG